MRKDYLFASFEKYILLFLFCFLLLSGKLSAQLNGTYTIGTLGTEDYTTISDAVSDLVTNGISGSVMFNISNGDYNEQLTIPHITGSGKNDTIVFKSASGNNTDVKIYFEPTVSGDNFTINLNGADFISFKDLTISSEGVSDFGTVITINNDLEKVFFINNYFIGKTGTVASETDKTIVRGDLGSNDYLIMFSNNVFDNCEEAIRYEHPDSFIFIENTIVNDDLNKGLYFNDFKNSIISDNTITGILSLYFMYGTTPVSACNNTIKGYIILYEAGSTSDSYPLLVYNNFLRGGIIVNNSKYAKVYNNSVYNSSYYPLQVNSASSDIKILNNIFYANNPAYTAMLINDIASIDTLDFNNLYGTGSKLVTANSIDYATLVDWQAAVNQSQNSYNENVNFVDAINADLHIAVGEPDLFGIACTGINLDIDGETRHAKKPNIGADEYSDRVLSGNYTIGKNGTEDFASFADAIEELINYGVAGSTYFGISSGTYDEQLTIPEIAGTSEDANITFYPNSELAHDVTLTYNLQVEDSLYIVKLDGADYIQFQLIDFIIDEDSYSGIVFDFKNGASHNNISYCNFTGLLTESDGGAYSIIYSQDYSATIDEYNSIYRNNFNYGSYGIYFSGIDNNNLEKGNFITNNKFTNQYKSAIYLYYQDSCTIKGDTITISSTQSNPYGIYLYGSQKEMVFNNQVNIFSSSETAGGYGIYIYDGVGEFDQRASVFNNFINISTNAEVNTFGIVLRNSPYINVYSNTVNISGTNSISQAFRLWGSTSNTYYSRNNIFANRAGGYALWSDVTTDFESDYNNFFTTGSSLISGFDSFADWQTSTSKDEHSLSVNPVFVSNNDLHIYHALEDFDGAGTLLNTGNTDLDYYLNRDIDLELRDVTNPDIGADEYTYISEDNDFLTYSFEEQTGDAIINAETHNISIEVEYGTILSSLTATFTMSENATVAIGIDAQVSGVTENDFTSPVIYTVTAEDDTEQEWTVTVTEALNEENDILTFNLEEETGDATINSVNFTVQIEVEYDTDLTDLVASFTLSTGATAKIGTTNQESAVTSNDFTNDVIYTIVAENGDEQNWTVSVMVGQNSEADIVSYSMTEQSAAATISPTEHTVTLQLVPGTSLTSLIATFTLSGDAIAYINAVEQISGVTSNDFGSSVMYIVEAQDGTQQIWTITVTVEPYHGNDFLTFSFAEQTGSADIDDLNHSIDIEVVEGTDLTSLVASFTISEGATININSTTQISGETANDFSSMVSYEIIAEDETSQVWEVNVTVEDNSTGIENIKEGRFILFPNPAVDFINIKSNSIRNEFVELEIIDITGKVISSKQIYSDTNLNVAFYFDNKITTGIYFLRIKTTNMTNAQRFIVK